MAAFTGNSNVTGCIVAAATLACACHASVSDGVARHRAATAAPGARHAYLAPHYADGTPLGKRVPQAGRSRARFDAALAQWDATPAHRRTDAQELALDALAGQRYASSARLYWHTDLAAAQLEAATQGKPILSLRMLGNLTDDWSCANSRFFRTVLYANPKVAALLRTRFVLHWSSERPIPIVTTDMGDGRLLVRTTTGNGAHYVLSTDGTPLDVLPGLYAPNEFVAALTRAAEFATTYAAHTAEARWTALKAFHRAQRAAQAVRWRSMPEVPLAVAASQRGRALPAEAYDPLAEAQLATVSKAKIEAPQLATMRLGPDPRTLEARTAAWVSIGLAMFRPPRAPGEAVLPEPGAAGLPATVAPMAAAALPSPGSLAEALPAPALSREELEAIISPASQQLLARIAAMSPGASAVEAGAAVAPGADASAAVAPGADASAAVALGADASAAVALGAATAAQAQPRVLRELALSVLGDTAQNEFRLHAHIHDLFEQATAPYDFATLNRKIYNEVFHTAAADAWMGLLAPGASFVLPGEGVLAAAASAATGQP